MIASSTPPTTSTFSGGPPFSRDGRLKWIITIASRANGTLIQNTSRQRVQRPHHRDAVERAEHAAEFLRGADTAEHGGAVALRPQVGGQRQGDGQ